MTHWLEKEMVDRPSINVYSMQQQNLHRKGMVCSALLLIKHSEESDRRRRMFHFMNERQKSESALLQSIILRAYSQRRVYVA